MRADDVVPASDGVQPVRVGTLEDEVDEPHGRSPHEIAARWLKLFEHIYIINLASRADRRLEMEQQLRWIGLSISDSRIEFFEASRPDDAENFPSIGARGCFLSHLRVLQDAVANNRSRILILEDDADFTPEFTRPQSLKLQHIVRQQDWSFFYGGYAADNAPGVMTNESILAVVSPTRPVGLSHMIGFAGTSTMRDVADYLEAMMNRSPGSPLGGPMHVDGAYSWYRRAHPESVTFAAVPALSRQRSSRTDVHDLRWFDRIPGVRHSMMALRQLRNAARYADDWSVGPATSRRRAALAWVTEGVDRVRTALLGGESTNPTTPHREPPHH